MFKRTLLLVALASVATASAWAAGDPMIGKWKLNSEKTHIFDEMKVSNAGSNTYSFDFGGGHPETIVADGTDQPGLEGTTLAVSAEASDTWKVVRKKDGRIELTAFWTLSKDGHTLRDNYSELDADGKTTMHVVYLYDCRGGGSGFACDWVSTSQQMDNLDVLDVRPYEENGISISSSLGKSTTNVTFDGKEVPLPGAEGRTVSTQRQSDRAVELTFKHNGKASGTQQLTVSEDGKTLTMTLRFPGRNEPNVMVYDRQ